jgi:F0F1-type ATP synthase assembly protein I
VSEERRRQAQAFRRIADASAMGIAFPIAIAIGYFWGRSLDRYLSTAPWLTCIFTAFGVGAGFLNAIRVAVKIGKEEDQADEDRRRE